MLADWGADVIRVERPTGDPYAGLATQGIGRDSKGRVNLSLALVNRGKRSIALDLHQEQAHTVLHQLLETADVFITNLRENALRKLHLSAEELSERYPGLVYARANGYGARGPEAGRAGYDASAFWARGGLAHILTPSACPDPIIQRGAMGDRNAAVALAFGISTALVKRGRTGKGSVVDVSLLATAVWTLASDVLSALQGIVPGELPRRINPVYGTYRTKDGRHIYLVFLESDRYWATFCDALGRPDLISDPRFADLRARGANLDACVAELEAEFAARTFEECKELLGAIDVPWAPVQTVEELLDDPQVIANGYIGEVHLESGDQQYSLPTGPVQIDGRPPEMTRAPESGENTEELLLELGYSWDEIVGLKDAGTIP
jgi:crotonobetainyl-CoA:carnitine CoA-transferase CaiB-like acyl-CoA transferase